MPSADFPLTPSRERKHPVSTVVLEVIEAGEKLIAQQDYQDFCLTEFDLLHKGINPRTWQSETIAAKTSGDLSHVLKVLKENVRITKLELRQQLTARFPHATVVGLNRSLDLVARLWLMLNFQDREFESLRRQATCIEWDDAESLHSCIQRLFPGPRWEINAAMSRLSPYFKASFLTQVCGLRIEWTTSIHDHLHLDRHRNLLRIFPYKHHLSNLLKSTADPLSPIPQNVLRETLRTLDLLFPIWDSDTVRLLVKEKQSFHETPPFSSSASAGSLMDFHHWRDRLLELREVLDTPPVSWAQLWRDRRNPQQFWTFWIALVILLLTGLSFAVGVVQMWASVKAFKLAQQQALNSQTS